MHQDNINFNGDMCDVADVCGSDIATKLIQHYPCTHFYVPHNAKNPSLNIFTEEEALKLVEFYAGDTIYISAKSDHNASKRDDVKKLTAEGRTAQQIAVVLKMSQGRVYQIKRALKDEGIPCPKGQRQDDNQLSLF